jgi:E3 ubiquitin-protein ligase SHPRH
MVSLLPRLSSFAVSGTPARSQIYDLLHVLQCVILTVCLFLQVQLRWHTIRFLRVDNIIGSQAMWKRLLKPGFAGLFQSFFRQHAIRQDVFGRIFTI